MMATRRPLLLAAAALAAVLLCQGHAATTIDPVAATKVVQLAAADPAVLASAGTIIDTVRNSVLAGGLTGVGQLNVKALAANPQVLAAIVPFISAAANASGPYWLAVVPAVPAVPKNVSAAAGLIQDAAKDPTVLAAAQTLVKAVRTSALTNAGWSVAAIASDPNVQAAIVPVLEAAANCSALNWAEVDPSVVPTAAPQTNAVSSFLTTLQQAAAPQQVSSQQAAPADSSASAFPALPNLFSGRKLRQVIVNPADLLGGTSDNPKDTPSAADAERLNAALGLQAPTGAVDQAAQERQAMLQSVRSSDAATTSKAMQNFNVVALNPNLNNAAADSAQGPSSALASTPAAAAPAVPAAAPYIAPAAPQKVAILNADGTSTIETAAAPAPVKARARPNQNAPSQVSQGVLQRPSGTDDSTAATGTDAAGSATGAKDLLSSLTGQLSDSPGVATAPASQSFSWLQPPPGSQADLPAQSVAAQQRAAQAAAAPRSSPDEANVRSFIDQTGTATTLQGRRLIEAQQRPVSGASQLAARLTDAFGRTASAVLAPGAAAPSSTDSLPPSSDLLVGLAPASGPLWAAVTPAVSAWSSANSAAAQQSGAAPAPAAAPSHAQSAAAVPSSITSEVAADAVQAAVPSHGMLLPPKPPFHEFVELPGELGILPALPGTVPLGAGLP